MYKIVESIKFEKILILSCKVSNFGFVLLTLFIIWIKVLPLIGHD